MRWHSCSFCAEVGVLQGVVLAYLVTDTQRVLSLQVSLEQLQRRTAALAQARGAAAGMLAEWRRDDASMQQAASRLKTSQARAADEARRLQSWQEQVGVARS